MRTLFLWWAGTVKLSIVGERTDLRQEKIERDREESMITVELRQATGRPNIKRGGDDCGDVMRGLV